jgi:hypothetical protein
MTDTNIVPQDIENDRFADYANVMEMAAKPAPSSAEEPQPEIGEPDDEGDEDEESDDEEEGEEEEEETTTP